MELSSEIIVALIASIAALIGSMLTYLTTRSKLHIEAEKAQTTSKAALVEEITRSSKEVIDHYKQMVLEANENSERYKVSSETTLEELRIAESLQRQFEEGYNILATQLALADIPILVSYNEVKQFDYKTLMQIHRGISNASGKKLTRND